MKRARVIIPLVLVLAFLMGFTLAALATAHSGERRFFGPTLVNGQYQCATQQAYIYTNPPAGFKGVAEYTDRYNGSACGTLANAPAGYLGARVQLVRASNGTICTASLWEYNSSPLASFNALEFFSSSAACPVGAAYYSNGRSQYYNANTAKYVTSQWITSPNQNL